MEKVKPVSEEFAEMMGVDLKGLLRKVRDAEAVNQPGVSVTGAQPEVIFEAMRTTGWLLFIDTAEGTPVGGSFFLKRPQSL